MKTNPTRTNLTSSPVRFAPIKWQAASGDPAGADAEADAGGAAGLGVGCCVGSGLGRGRGRRWLRLAAISWRRCIRLGFDQEADLFAYG